MKRFAAPEANILIGVDLIRLENGCDALGTAPASSSLDHIVNPQSAAEEGNTLAMRSSADDVIGWTVPAPT